MDKEDIRDKIMFMVNQLNKDGLDKAYKLVQRIWIKQEVAEQ